MARGRRTDSNAESKALNALASKENLPSGGAPEYNFPRRRSAPVSNPGKDEADTERLSKSSEEFVPFKDSVEFQEYVAQNLWADRRKNNFPWKCDVFEFIREVYAPFLGHGLVQSDIKACDPQLYAQLHKQLTAMDKEQKEKTLSELNLLKQSDARLAAIDDEEKREALLEARRLAREAMRLARTI